MSPRICSVLLSALLAGSLVAQPKPKPKPPPIKPEPLTLLPGQPMSQRALVQKPVPLAGLRGWTLETKRHRGPMYCFAISPDEKLVATGGHDCTIRIWEMSSGKLVRALVGHHYVVTSIVWSPDGKILASAGSSDGTVRLWDPHEGQPLRTFTMKMGYASWVAWSPDGKTLAAAGGTSGYIWLYDIAAERGDVAAEMGNPVFAISWSPNSKYLAACSTKTPVWLIDRDTNRMEKMLGDAKDAAQSVVWSPDGKMLAAGSLSAINLWDAVDAKKVDTIATAAATLSWSLDGKSLASSASHSLVTFWDVATRKMKRPPVPNTAAYATSWQSNNLLAVLSQNTLALWKPDGETPLKTFELAGQTPPQWNPGRPVITGIGEKSLALWTPTGGKKIAALEGHSGPVTVAAWSKDGKMLATGGYDGRILFWDSTGKRVGIVENAGAITALSWSPDGKQIARGATDHQVTIYDVPKGEKVRTFEEHGAVVYALAWCPAGKLIAAGGYDRPVKVWNLETGKDETLSKEWPTGLTIAWNSNGKILATGGGSDALRFWSPMGKAPAQIGERSPQPPASLLAFAPGNEIIAVCRTGGGIGLYSVAGGKYLHGLSNWASCSSLAWSPKGETIAVGCQDRTVRFWDSASGLLRAMLIAEPNGTLAVLPDGHYRCDPGVEADLIVVVQTERGQETLTPSRFAQKYKWKSQSSMVKLTGS